MRKFCVVLVLITAVICSSQIKEAQESASLLLKSKGAIFPLNLIYFYSGVDSFNKVIQKYPTNLDVRYIRAKTMFEFKENKYALDICRQDLELMLLFLNKNPEFFEGKLSEIYFILTYSYLLQKDYVKAYLYYELLLLSPKNITYVQEILKRFPDFPSKIINK